MNGPFPIVCRAHSGGRFLSEIYIKNGIQMGQVHPKTKDTRYFAPRKNLAVRRSISNSNEYITTVYKGKKQLQNLMRNCIERFLDNEIIDKSAPFGWKFGETLFTLPVVFDLYPTAKAIHLIRDGRDVMLSRIEARFDAKYFHQKFNRMLVLGDAKLAHFNGQYIDEEVISKHRVELEFVHWNSVIEYGKKLRCYSSQYLEVKYENLCREPQETLTRIFNFLEVPLLQSTVEWAQVNASTDRIGKWKTLTSNTLEKVAEIGVHNLLELGYTD